MQTHSIDYQIFMDIQMHIHNHIHTFILVFNHHQYKEDKQSVNVLNSEMEHLAIIVTFRHEKTNRNLRNL